MMSDINRKHVARAPPAILGLWSASLMLLGGTPLVGAHLVFHSQMGHQGAVAQLAGLGIQVASDYGSIDTHLYPWKAVVEPHKTTTLQAIGGEDSGRYMWTITYQQPEGGNVTVMHKAAGSVTTMVFPQAPQSFTLHVQELDTSGQVLQEISQEVMCKYVRRELRELNADDREKFLSALEKVHRLDLDEGRALYGPKFVNYKHQLQKHLGRMTLEGYSPYHNGQVFLTAHFAFTLELEQALQAIDPSIAMPYWEYTLDHALYGDRWQTESPIFSDAFFGAYNQSKGASPSLGGRWKSLPIPLDFSMPERNAYGRMTDSINPDPSGFVGRSTGMCGLETRALLPGCTELEGVLAARSFDALAGRVEYGYHGPLHALVGGYWDCPYSLGDMAEEYPLMAPILEGIGVQANTLWRSAAIRHVTTCPQAECALTDPIQDCSCNSPTLDAPEYELSYQEAYRLLDAASVFDMLSGNHWLSDYITSDRSPSHDSSGKQKGPSIDFKFNLPQDQNEMLIKWLAHFVTHPGKMSPFATPLAATNDPLFAPSHSAYLRLHSFMKLSGRLETEIWTEAKADMVGHNAEDQLPFRGFLGDGEQDPDHYYTNLELLSMMAPDNPSLPYVYANFRWDHCTEASS